MSASQFMLRIMLLNVFSDFHQCDCSGKATHRKCTEKTIFPMMFLSQTETEKQIFSPRTNYSREKKENVLFCYKPSARLGKINIDDGNLESAVLPCASFSFSVILMRRKNNK